MKKARKTEGKKEVMKRKQNRDTKERKKKKERKLL